MIFCYLRCHSRCHPNSPEMEVLFMPVALGVPCIEMDCFWGTSRMSDSHLCPSHPHSLQRRKRPASLPSPWTMLSGLLTAVTVSHLTTMSIKDTLNKPSACPECIFGGIQAKTSAFFVCILLGHTDPQDSPTSQQSTNVVQKP